MRKKSKFKYIVYIFLFSIVCSIFLLYHFSSKTLDTLMVYARVEAEKIVSTIINKIVLEEVSSKVSFDELVLVTKSKDGDIQTINFDTLAVNNILSFITDSVEKNLNSMENGNLEFMGYSDLQYKPKIDELKRGIVAVIPIGVSYNNHFLSNLGPKIPVRLRYVGSVSTNLVTSVKDYGINNALIEVSVHITVVEQVNIPFNSSSVVVENDIPISLKVIQGRVPVYYGGTYTKSSPILSTNIDN